MPVAGAFAEERGISMDGISDPTFAEAFDVDVPGC
jgi:hypothetical protein